jgi:8-oxo-dGTP pyrophosphatase MutT (NUDIX family)
VARSFSGLVADLDSAFARPLPAGAAHALMAPQPPRRWPEGVDPAHVRDAAGLLLLFPVSGEAHVVLTVRAGTLERHGGQVSLPGGVLEPGEAFAHAALREAHEEIAVSPGEVRIVGALTPIDIPVSGFRLHPVVGTSEARPAFAAAGGEVAKILEIAVDDLMRPGVVASVSRDRDGRRVAAPAFHAAGEEIWGATAMVLAEFLVMAGWRGV